MKYCSILIIVLVSLEGHALSMQSIFLGILYPILILTGTFTVFKRKESTFNKKMIPLLMFMALLMAMIFSIKQGLVRQLCLFLGFTQVILSFQKKTIRQYRLLIFTTILHVVGMGATSKHYLTGIIFVFYCVTFPFAFAEIEARSGKFMHKIQLFHRISYLLISIPMIILLFLSLPRTSNVEEARPPDQRRRENYFNNQQQTRHFRAINFRSPGYSDRVDLNYNGPTKITNKVVFSMRVPGILRKQPLYLRGFSFNQYSGGEWTSTIKEIIKRPIEDSYLELGNARSIPDTKLFNIDFKLDTRLTHDTVFTTLFPNSISDFNFKLRQDAVNDLKILRAQHHHLHYRLKVCRERIPLTRKDLAQELDEYLAVAPGLQQYLRDFAWDIIGSKNLSLRERALKLKKHLTTKYSYSHVMNMDVPDQLAHLDPIERFLFHDYFGHCEKFATAYVLLCRSVGIPSRIVTGFVYYPFDDNGKEWIEVRQMQSHAWAEIHLPGKGWIAVEATASHIANRPVPQSTPQAMLVQARNFWTTHVLHFNKGMQINLGLNFGLFTLAFNAGGSAGLIMMVMIMSAFPGILIILPILFTLYKFKQILKNKNNLKQIDSVLNGKKFESISGISKIEFYRNMLEILEKQGITRKSNETGIEFMMRFHGHACEEVIKSITQFYYRTRYGNYMLTANDLQLVKKLLYRLKKFEIAEYWASVKV